MQESYLQEKQDLWAQLDEAKLALIDNYAKDFKNFMNLAKTEREFVDEALIMLKAKGYKELNSIEKLNPGDKVYMSIRGKGLAAAVIGTDSILEGMNLLGSHIDSPRFDLKAHAVQEHNQFSYLATQYYGGVKKYQWTTIPLALHGVITKADGSTVKVVIGEDEADPVFYFTDLLPHLGRQQMAKSANEFINAEQFKLLVGSEPISDKDAANRYSKKIYELFYQKYGVTEVDLQAAELEIVPASKARDVGLDRSMIASYGQDDKLCSYASLTALADLDNVKRTAVAFLYDKEEIGSEGNTGAQSRSYEVFLMSLVKKCLGSFDALTYSEIIGRSYMISSDVAAGFDPMFSDVFDSHNNAYLAQGLCLIKHTGSGGKGGSSDANSEFMRKVIAIFEESALPWQVGTLGKVDVGGGGTIAKFAAKTGMQVIDAGIPVLCMHAPMEICHKLDLYYSYLAYKEFLAAMTLLAGDK